MNKPPFDPNQPFQPAGKPAFDPNQPFQSVDDKPQGFIKKAWNTLSIPENMSRKGFQELGAMVPPPPEPTGNLTKDVLRGTPSILASSALKTAEKVAPGFVSAPSILMEGAGPLLRAGAKPMASLMKGAGSQLEEVSGTAPKAKGALEAAYKDSKLIFSQGVKEAGEGYRQAKEAAGSTARLTTELSKTLGKIPDNNAVVARAMELAEKGDINPSEAQLARKSVDAMWKSRQYPKEVIDNLRGLFDKVVKSDAGLTQADQEYARAIKASALRNFFPQNKYGGASPFKILLSLFGAGIKSPVRTAADVTLFSPMAQGVAATGAGVAARQVVKPLMENPAGIPALMKLFKKDDSN